MSQRISTFLLTTIALLFALNLVKGGEPQYILALSEFIVIVGVVVWLYSMVAKGGFTFRSSVANLPAILLAGVLFISTIFSRNPYPSFKGLHEVFSYLLLFLICMNLPKETLKRKVAYILIGVGVVQSVHAIVQAASGTSRVSGTLVYPTYLVDTLIIGLSLAAGFVLFSRSSGLKRLAVYVPISLLLFVALFLTRARAGLIALAASLIVLGILKSKRWLAILVGVVIVAAVVPNPIRDRILTAGKQDIYAMERPNIWKQSLEIAKMRPSAGVGFRNYVYYSRMTNFPVQHAVGRYAKVAKIAHNQYLQYLATTGIAGLAAFLVFFSSVLVSGVRFAKTKDPLIAGSLAAVIALLAHSLVDNALYLPINGYAFFALAGILCSASVSMRSFRPPKRAKIYLFALAIIYAVIVLRPAVSISFYNSMAKKVKRNDVDRAIGSCRVALALSPNEAIYHNALGKLYAKRYDETKSAGDLYLTQTRFESAIKSNPVDRIFWEDFADFIYDQKQNIGQREAYSGVATLLRGAVNVDPYNPFLRKKLAAVYIEGGSYDKAASELKMLVSVEPNYLVARFMLAQVYGTLGMTDKKEEQYQVLREKRLQHLELRIQNDYEKTLLEFDWSLLPAQSYISPKTK
ncbi:hypothetical protein E3J62_11940 [candidate division TA06 bacterium]|uniref:O-antigen ligase-related domain-containing protein n=1 Tax=candidate division TA06 bacterium TaxID=2250710 RepID=A0A523UNC4_UNCT6|nr:MAG: hypothetical protein E3J62_11940 [candidate division TA06 bacterium]